MTALRPDLSLALRWLLSHPEPAVRYRARLWLEGRAPGDPLARAERELLVTGPVVAEVLARQAPDGSWHGPAFYVPKHRSTFHVLAALAEMGLTREISPAVAKAAEFAFAFQGRDGEFYQIRRAAGGRPSSAAPVPCLTARAAAFLAEMGYADDPRLERAVSYLVSRQRPDGGWSCLQRAVRRGEPVAKGCLGVIAAFLDLAEKTPRLLGGHPATLAAARFVEALYLRDPKGYHVADTWKELFFPYFPTDLASTGRQLLATTGLTPRVKEGLALCLAKARPDGLWATDGRPYRPPVRVERRGRSCPWVTLRAARFVLEGARRRE